MCFAVNVVLNPADIHSLNNNDNNKTSYFVFCRRKEIHTGLQQKG